MARLLAAALSHRFTAIGRRYSNAFIIVVAMALAGAALSAQAIRNVRRISIDELKASSGQRAFGPQTSFRS